MARSCGGPNVSVLPKRRWSEGTCVLVLHVSRILAGRPFLSTRGPWSLGGDGGAAGLGSWSPVHMLTARKETLRCLKWELGMLLEDRGRLLEPRSPPLLPECSAGSDISRKLPRSPNIPCLLLCYSTWRTLSSLFAYRSMVFSSRLLGLRGGLLALLTSALRAWRRCLLNAADGMLMKRGRETRCRAPPPHARAHRSCLL